MIERRQSGQLRQLGLMMVTSALAAYGASWIALQRSDAIHEARIGMLEKQLAEATRQIELLHVEIRTDLADIKHQQLAAFEANALLRERLATHEGLDRKRFGTFRGQ